MCREVMAAQREGSSEVPGVELECDDVQLLINYGSAYFGVFLSNGTNRYNLKLVRIQLVSTVIPSHAVWRDCDGLPMPP